LSADEIVLCIRARDRFMSTCVRVSVTRTIADWNLMLRPGRSQHWPRLHRIGHAAGRALATGAGVATVRTIFTLTLAARGLIVIVNAVGHPWDWLVRTLVLAVLALGCFAVAQRSGRHRCGWLLSGGAAAGLAIASFYDFTAATVTPAAATTVLVACIVLLAAGTRGRTGLTSGRTRRPWRP
jgi:hypothetical protein